MGPKKGKKGKEPVEETPVATEEPPAPEPEVPKDIRIIKIRINSILGLRPVYVYSEMTLDVEFGNESIYVLPKVHLDETIPVNKTLFLEFDWNDPKSYDRFLTNPLVFRVTETESEVEPMAVVSDTGFLGRAQWKSEESVLELEEALLGTKTSEQKATGKKKSKTGSKSSKTDSKASKGKEKKSSGSLKKGGSKSSKGSKGSSKGKRKVSLDERKPKAIEKPVGPQSAGWGFIDLLPIFLGEHYLVETVILKGDTTQMLDDRVRCVAKLPRIRVEVDIDQPIPSGQILSITLESIFNIPLVMSNDMKYQILIDLPNKQKINFTKCQFKETHRKPLENKKWFETDIDTGYILGLGCEDLKSALQVPIENALSKDTPRLEYNQIKRNYVSKDDESSFLLQFKKYRRIGVEIYVERQAPVEVAESKSSAKSGKRKPSKDKSSKAGGKSKASKKKSKASTSLPEDDKPEADYLHLMAYIDICRLLYPGERRTRVACPLRTYNGDEIEEHAGLKDSFFRPKPPPPPPPVEVVPTEVKEKKGKGKGKAGSKSSKSSKGSKDSKGSKGSKKSGKKGGKGNLKSRLPPPPPKPEPSSPVYDEEGYPCFVILEIEVSDAMVPSRDILTLAHELQGVLTDSMDKICHHLPKDVKSGKITEQLFHDTIKSLTRDIKYQHRDFLESIDCASSQNNRSFLKYLQQKGFYQNYLSTITYAISLYVNAVFNADPTCTSKDYHVFISSVYIKLVQQMNLSINEFLMAGIGANISTCTPNKFLLAFAHEAMELGAIGLANRYMMQRICSEETNPDYWFDYSILHMHTGDTETAIECVLEALKLKPTHPNSLLIFALMLARKKKIAEAETCLLNLTLNDPNWVEGWGALYCIYHRQTNEEGKEVSLEIAEKKLNVRPPSEIHDLAWSTVMVPNTVFYRSCCYFISLRLFEEAELMLSVEVLRKEECIQEYLRAVIQYYRKDYEHAILHIDNAMNNGGCDFTAISLRGHIMASMDKEQCAIDEYKRIYELFNQPEEIYTYMVFVRTGLCYSRLGDSQRARAAFMQACHIKGSPYTWLCTGVLYYYQNDFISAEECLMESNSQDNQMPETWAYLTLVNAKLGKKHEANMCHHQVLENKLQNEELMNLVEDSIKHINDKETLD